MCDGSWCGLSRVSRLVWNGGKDDGGSELYRIDVWGGPVEVQ